MERDPEQAIVGQFALWIHDIDPGRSYWLLILTNHGIYDDENTRIAKLLQKYSQSSGIPHGIGQFRKLIESKTRLDVTLDFFLWLYIEDKSLCFRIMKQIFEDYKDDSDVPEPYEPVGKLKEFEPNNNGHYPEIDEEELVSLSAHVIGDDEFGFYRYISSEITEATKECSIENAVREYDHNVLASFLMLLSANRRTISRN